MGTPKKTINKKLIPKSSAAKKPEEPIDPKTKKKIIDDDDEDEDFDMPLDDLGGYESFDGYEEDDDY